MQHALLVHASRRKLTGIQSELDERRAQISDALAEIELNATSALEAMLAMLNALDAASHNHAHRVAKLAVDLAMAMGIGEPQLSDIERAALLHDLGRLAMPDDLLARARSALSDADRVRLHTYPLHGYDMLRNVAFLATANPCDRIRPVIDANRDNPERNASPNKVSDSRLPRTRNRHFV